MSGLGLLQHVKTSCDGVHVIIMTGKLTENSGTLYLNRGARCFFRKPIDRDTLLAILDSISSGSENQVIYRG
jgi:DNA-binding NtrC family response regulator